VTGLWRNVEKNQGGIRVSPVMLVVIHWLQQLTLVKELLIILPVADLDQDEME
jgi:hypothetical protein